VSFVIIMVLLLVVMYVLMIRPQRQRQAQQKTTIDTAGVGDDILTTGGIYGTIRQTEGDDIVVEIADGVTRTVGAAYPARWTPEDEERERLRRAKQRPPKPTKQAKTRGHKLLDWIGSDDD